MARDRIAFETSQTRKRALHRALRAEGISASEWLNDQLDLMLSDSASIAPSYQEIESLDALADQEGVLARLMAIDWAFDEDDTLYLSHDIHPYPAKFIPQIPGNLIASLSLPGDLVLDPFGGSGTTALEALRLGRRVISVDANPLAALIGRVKTATLNESAWLDLRTLKAGVTARLREAQRAPDDCRRQLLSEYAAFVPAIPNLPKWFPESSVAELAFIRAQAMNLESEQARDVALLAMSRIVLKVSFQDSETRYASRPRSIPDGQTLQLYLTSLDTVIARVAEVAPEINSGVASFQTQDSRFLGRAGLGEGTVDLVVTSPPYGNATDYHLYHRFRLFWLGADPRELGQSEIGSHLRHQRLQNGFGAYLSEMEPVLQELYRVLRPGRYAALVVGESIYEGEHFDGADALASIGERLGFLTVGIIRRTVHRTKRSFIAAARRADSEKILVLRRPPEHVALTLLPPAYRRWPYEEVLRAREAEALFGCVESSVTGELCVNTDSCRAVLARRLAFTRAFKASSSQELTWQSILENGWASPSSRKDPKYVTHGVHAYKGKFYPQLAKSLLNIAGAGDGTSVLDPFCGSGTTILEARLNGLCGFGCDLNPLAAKIARAKVGILDVDSRLLSEVASALAEQVQRAPLSPNVDWSQFDSKALDEIRSWFPSPVVAKLSWLLSAVRRVGAGVVTDFFEILISDLVRGVSQQDPTDLRIRRRSQPLTDADVYGLFLRGLSDQMGRLQHWWARQGYRPFRDHSATIVEGDARDPAVFARMGLPPSGLDVILTSPPYATALPYIDTDRLSLLILFGMPASARRPLEHGLIGSREIRTSERKGLEADLETASDFGLPSEILQFVTELHSSAVREDDVGFRRRNQPALLLRFFRDMKQVFANTRPLLREGADAFVVIGDNFTRLGKRTWRIPTTEFIRLIAEHVGFATVEEMPISVTTENLKHVKHAITANVVLRFRTARSGDRAERDEEMKL